MTVERILRAVADCRWFPAAVGNILFLYVIIVAYSGRHIV